MKMSFTVTDAALARAITNFPGMDEIVYTPSEIEGEHPVGERVVKTPKEMALESLGASIGNWFLGSTAGAIKVEMDAETDSTKLGVLVKEERSLAATPIKVVEEK